MYIIYVCVCCEYCICMCVELEFEYLLGALCIYQLRIGVLLLLLESMLDRQKGLLQMEAVLLNHVPFRRKKANHTVNILPSCICLFKF